MKQLEEEVARLQTALKDAKKRSPQATSGGKTMQALLEQQVRSLEEQLLMREEEFSHSMRTLQDKYTTMEVHVHICLCVSVCVYVHVACAVLCVVVLLFVA